MGAGLYDSFHILAIALFAINMNSVAPYLRLDTGGSLFVVGFSICYRSKFMHNIEDYLHAWLHNLDTWVDENCFMLSSTKTICIHRCRLCGFHHDPHSNNSILNVPTFKLLSVGLILNAVGSTHTKSYKQM